MIRTIEERVVYENDFTTIFDDRVEFPDGHQGNYIRSRWKAPHGVAILPVIGSDVLLIETYRYSERSWSIEIPQGFGTAGSTPVADARRELCEETGLTTDRIVPLLQFGHDFVTYAFHARIDEDAAPNLSRIEKTESFRGFHRVATRDIDLGLISLMGLRDAPTIACLLALRSFSGN